ncbi:glyoxylase-like metal-dependent hydrolase (beta-lactamase superfamily II) [Clostridium tetanomorphum]|uniref:MBL fold metallo-hydrolase n=1 Tax=Clostridium tetanomorphum TaxID=1553 RepID=A0A923J1A7_CLOTT|nr:MBL fold metallo-hydrolase [Clostridium tetanomorphum]KAJ50611.1 zinc metallohydrolase [Clostridium tetanomorphum DSM 665]MBC2399071.1 MBL fold metallo-hydrolase [Clostridium tetanomorphum]MBP1862686.1 glyoxylase-like metal-dependent hydrolase (beta-lactamase superfamily II) [Clostridium tetanomorphum]NRS85474.1 glyoxylase-like metal-dependent hydrolase (beta-lactamase superfamily II) [Clostridium tetanomorphum]NRZ98588.1 glyoxylase-like metal-dependent hydrolase (beta-lactamase superfamily
MELIKIKGNTYYINAPTNIGVYIFKNKNCILIDTGINTSHAKKIDEVLIENGLHPKYIVNTHNHIDHCGGNHYFQNNYPGCLVYTSAKEKLFMENIELCPQMLYGSLPIKGLYRVNKSFTVDFVLDYGINKINDEKFQVLPLKGHTDEQIGFITPEKVCFLGDSIFSHEIIEKYSLPYLYDIEESIKTLKSIKEIDADFFLVGHSNNLLDKSEIPALVHKNLKNIENYIDQILELLDQPLTKEDLLQNIVILNDLPMNFTQYHLNLSAVSAFISYLYNKDLVDSSIEDGKLYFFKKA